MNGFGCYSRSGVRYGSVWWLREDTFLFRNITFLKIVLCGFSFLVDSVIRHCSMFLGYQINRNLEVFEIKHVNSEWTDLIRHKSLFKMSFTS